MPQPAADVDAVIERYARFARQEAPGRSALYRQWAERVAADRTVAAVLARIRPARRQPPLVFAVTRMLGVGTADAAAWAEWLVAHADDVVAECTARSLQTNEPLRCGALLPALCEVDGPIALLEVGASAGLCLYPDRYSYRYQADDDTVRVDPRDGPSTVLLPVRWHGPAPVLRPPEIVWRAGVDLHPRDAADPDDRAWLTGLVWPGETGRARRVRAALDVVAADPPQLVAGDAADVLDLLVDRAPEGATLVVTTPGVLVHVPRPAREDIIATARRRGRWITLDPVGLHAAVRGTWEPEPDGDWPNGVFALAVDGIVRAAADPLGAAVQPVGGRLRWRPAAGVPDHAVPAERDRALLDFEARWPRHTAAKEEAIRRELAITPARYYQLLGRVVDTAAALAHDPLLVGRLRRRRDDRIRARRAQESGEG